VTEANKLYTLRDLVDEMKAVIGMYVAQYPDAVPVMQQVLDDWYTAHTAHQPEPRGPRPCDYCGKSQTIEYVVDTLERPAKIAHPQCWLEHADMPFFMLWYHYVTVEAERRLQHYQADLRNREI
jgi:hypothetical protein